MRFTSAAGLAAVLAASTSVSAAEPVDVSPLVNDRTVIVTQIDLARLKLRPAFDWAIDVVKRAGVPVKAVGQADQAAAAISLIGQPSVDGLRRAGVTTLALVVQLNDNLRDDVPPVLLVAVPKPADPQKVIAALAPLGMRNGEKGDLMVFSPNLPPGVLAKLQPTDRPDLAVTLGDSALAAAAALSPSAKADVLTKTMSPKDTDAAAVVRDVKRYDLRIDTAAAPHLGVVAQTESPEAAAALKETVTKPREGVEGRAWASMAKSLPLTVDGASLVLSAGQPEIDAFAKSFAKVARQGTAQAQSMSNLRSLIMAAIMSANDNHGVTPASLDDLAKYLAATTKTSSTPLTNPSKPDLGTNGYVYVRSVETLTGAKHLHETVAMYEAGEFGDGINVAFWDGHVELVSDEAKFKAMLPAAAPTTAP